MVIQIINKGPEISQTNYYETPYGEKYFYLSLNAGAVRLLIPTSLEKEFLQELSQIEKVLITFQQDKIIILLEDYTESPYQIFLTYQTCDRKPLFEDNHKEIPFLAYIFKENKINLSTTKTAFLNIQY